MELTKYQTAIIEAVRDRVEKQGNKPGLLVEALAGTGKSFTLAQIAKSLRALGVHPGACRFVVFGKKNQIDLASKIGELGSTWTKSVQTLNSLGYGILRDCLGKNHRYFSLKSTKYLYLARDLGYLDKRDRDGNHNPGTLTYSENSPVRSDRHFTELLEKLRLHCCTGPDEVLEKLDNLNERYGWEFQTKHYQEIAAAAADCLREGIAQTEKGVIDFLDQLYYPWLFADEFAATFDLWSQKLKFLAVDEAQDTDGLQIQFLKLLHRPANNFFCFVGDRNQAVYYFRGCLSNGLDVISREFSCESLPLPINYRCGTRHLELVREIFPHIKIEAHSEAPEGEIRCIKGSQLLDMVGDRSLSYFGVSRKNAPLLSTAIQFLTAGIPAKIKDKSLGKRVLDTIKKVAKRYDPYTFLDDLEDWESKELERYSSEQKHQEIGDLAACLNSLFEAFELDTFEDWEDKINEIFDESKADEKPIDLYTIHSGKGGEGEVSFIIHPADMPIEYKSQTDEERQQEDNMIYVALTRCAANSNVGSGILCLVLKEDEKKGLEWPSWLPHKYRQIWGGEEEPDNPAAEKAGEDDIDAEDEPKLPPENNVIPLFGDAKDGLGLDDEDKKFEEFGADWKKSDWAEYFLSQTPYLSNAQIADKAGCSSMLVSKVRRKMESQRTIEKYDRRLAVNGRSLNVANLGTLPNPQNSKMAAAREILEQLTGHELRKLFEEFLGHSQEEEDTEDVPF